MREYGRRFYGRNGRPFVGSQYGRPAGVDHPPIQRRTDQNPRNNGFDLSNGIVWQMTYAAIPCIIKTIHYRLTPSPIIFIMISMVSILYLHTSILKRHIYSVIYMYMYIHVCGYYCMRVYLAHAVFVMAHKQIFAASAAGVNRGIMKLEHEYATMRNDVAHFTDIDFGRIKNMI